ncbi:MAG TPA: prepilin peptidase [Alphaproteobacteria bacterium]
MIADILVWLLIILISVLAGRDDWRRMQIPNEHSLVLLLIFPLAAYSEACVTLIPGLIAGGLTLFVGLLLYIARVMGGGDVKFMSAMALYMGLEVGLRYVLTMLLAGGILALLALYLRRHPERIPAIMPPESWLGRLRQDRGAPLPYGLAIGFAAIVTYGYALSKYYFFYL